VEQNRIADSNHFEHAGVLKSAAVLAKANIRSQIRSPFQTIPERGRIHAYPEEIVINRIPFSWVRFCRCGAEAVMCENMPAAKSTARVHYSIRDMLLPPRERRFGLNRTHQ